MRKALSFVTGLSVCVAVYLLQTGPDQVRNPGEQSGTDICIL